HGPEHPVVGERPAPERIDFEDGGHAVLADTSRRHAVERLGRTGQGHAPRHECDSECDATLPHLRCSRVLAAGTARPGSTASRRYIIRPCYGPGPGSAIESACRAPRRSGTFAPEPIRQAGALPMSPPKAVPIRRTAAF